MLHVCRNTANTVSVHPAAHDLRVDLPAPAFSAMARLTQVCVFAYRQPGAGSMFTIGLKGGYEAGVKMVERCTLFSHLVRHASVAFITDPSYVVSFARGNERACTCLTV